jgi:peroxiredoxin Q/BCP
VAYFTASCDPAEENKRFAESMQLDYPILSDPDKTVARAYGVVTEDRAVPFRWTFYIGKDGNLLHIDKEVKAGSHGKEIVERLKELKVEAATKK